MKAQELTKKNQELQQQLNTKNEHYYGELVIYLRTKGMMKDELTIEEKALEILQDILDAQKAGIDAQDYFGKEPKVFADELLTSVPTSLFDFLKLVLVALGAYLLFSLFPTLLSPATPFDLGTFGVVAIYSLIGVLFFVWLMGRSIYFKQKKVAEILTGAVLGGLLIGGILLAIVIKTPYQLKLDGVWSLLLLIGLLLIAGILFLQQSKEDKKVWVPFFPLVISCGMFGLLFRINSWAAFFETTTGKYTIAGILIAGLFIQYLLVYLYVKKLNRQNG